MTAKAWPSLRTVRRTWFARKAAVITRPYRAARAVRESGLFDEGWVREHSRDELGHDALTYYVRHQGDVRVSPNPCFDPDWYRETHPGLKEDPFIHFVMRGAANGESPHPCFDARWYLGKHPEAARAAGGPLGHYLSQGWRQGAEPSPAFDSGAYNRLHPDVVGPPFLHFARRSMQLLHETRGQGHVPRNVPDFDHDASRRLVSDLLTTQGRERPSPLVTVILPTKDRPAEALTAVESVLAQTYSNWQLVVVDDGGGDETARRVQPLLDDPRIEFVRRGRSGGVSAARNSGLARARGDYIAYLDSDNTWDELFLEVMVAFVQDRGARFAYAVSCLREAKPRGRVLYRATPFNREALEERNYIDCIVVLHERSLLDEVGPFDESLRRNVDWDLFMRMADRTDFAFVPFVATTYDPWEERDDRITVSEPAGFRYVVKSKRMMDWDATTAALGSRESGTVSCVIHATGPAKETEATVGRILGQGAHEIVIVDAGRPPAEFHRLQMLAALHSRVRTIRFSEELSGELAANLGFAASNSEFVVFVPDGSRPQPGWLASLLEPIRRGVCDAAQPLIINQAGVIHSAGLVFARNGLPHHLMRGFAGDAPEAQVPGQRSALSGCLAARALDVSAVRGFDPIFVNDVEGGDLSLRLAADRRARLWYTPESVLALGPAAVKPRGRSATGLILDNRAIFAERWCGRAPVDDSDAWARAGARIVGYEVEELIAGVRRGAAFEPVLVHDRAQRPLRWALKIGAPTVDRRDGWGDWHFASSLKAALERQGHTAVIDCKDAWHRPTSHLDDVVLALRGVSAYTPNPQHVNLLWIISHPQRVTRREVAMFDRAFAASSTYVRRFADEHDMAMDVLLQCADRERFRPVAPDPDRSHEVLFVGNARGLRPSVKAAIEAGYPPAVYGIRWTGLIPRRALKGTFIPNEELAAVYCGAGAVLNDHWEDMRDLGFLSNRLFDVAACAAPLVTDPVDGLSDVFGDAVEVFTDAGEMRDALRRLLIDSAERRSARLRLSDRIRTEHSFDARAEQLIVAAESARHGRGGELQRLGTG